MSQKSLAGCSTSDCHRSTLYVGHAMEDTVRVRCPYCHEWIDLYVDPDVRGIMIEDCAVCCRPWTVTVERDGDRLRVQVARAQ